MRWNTIVTSVFATSLLCASVGTQAAKGALEVVQSAPLNYAHLLEQAKAADPQAQYQLGHAFSTGINLPRDDAKAHHWLELAAKQGHAKAQYQLAQMLQYGQGQAPDLHQAKHYYQQAANQGHIDAQYSLGRIYQLANDGVKAWTWLALAADNGQDSVNGLKQTVAQSLSDTELSIAQQALTQLKGKQKRKQSLMFAAIGGK